MNPTHTSEETEETSENEGCCPYCHYEYCGGYCMPFEESSTEEDPQGEQ